MCPRGVRAFATRCGVVQRALSLLRANELGDDYAHAWAEWAQHEADLWDVASRDGLDERPAR
jgi:hypothetical protein